MARAPRIQLAVLQRESLLAAAKLSKNTPIHTVVKLDHMRRFVELGLAHWNGKHYQLSERGRLHAANIRANAGPGRPRKANPRTTAVYAVLTEPEKASVEAFAARNQTKVADVVRAGLKAVGALP